MKSFRNIARRQIALQGPRTRSISLSAPRRDDRTDGIRPHPTPAGASPSEASTPRTDDVPSAASPRHSEAAQQTSPSNDAAPSASSSANRHQFPIQTANAAESSKNAWVKSVLAPRESDSRSPSNAASIESKLNPAASWAARAYPPSNDPRDFEKPAATPSLKQRRSQGLLPGEKLSAATFTETMLGIFESALLGQSQSASSTSSAYTGKRNPWKGPSQGVRDDLGYYGSQGSGATRALKKEETEEDTATIERLDELREEMEAMRYDTELLWWAVENVLTPPKTVDGVPEFDPVYPRILAHLLKVIRVNYQNPHLTLAIFHYAQTSSIESYLSGCLAPAYNEVLRVRWDSFRDFEGVELAVREMEVNGVGWDRGTARIVGEVIGEVQKDLLDKIIKPEDAVYARLARLEKRLERDIRDQEAYENWRQGEKRQQRRMQQGNGESIGGRTAANWGRSSGYTYQ